jgi:hypothetical protein
MPLWGCGRVFFLSVKKVLRRKKFFILVKIGVLCICKHENKFIRLPIFLNG